jgi:NADP-dependent 3-hydroxy acid dehydrogenase YdfG
VAEELIGQNHRVAICARTKEKIDKMRESFEGIIAYEIDLADSDLVQGFIEKSIEQMEGLNVLILNAGVTGLRESKEYTYKVNEVANIAISKAAQKTLRDNNGTIVFITSGTAHTNLNGGIEPYRESKLRMEQWLQGFSKVPGNEKIRIFSINPGSVDTRMHKEVVEYGSGEIKERTERMLKEGLLRDPNIVGRIIAKISLGGKNFNPKTNGYDIPIMNCEVVKITDENIIFETDAEIS